MRLTLVTATFLTAALAIAGTGLALVETVNMVANAPNDPEGTAAALAADGQAKAATAEAIATGTAGNVQNQGNAAANLAVSVAQSVAATAQGVISEELDEVAWCMALQCSPLWPVYELLGQVGPVVADPGAAICAQPIADGSPVHVTIGAAGQELGASASVQACGA